MADPIRFLVVDDEPLAVERLQLLLARMEGVSLAGTASEGAAALRMVEATRPDAVLLDIAMPGMDGIDVARALARVPTPPLVIFVTAFDMFAVAAFDVEAVDYVMKPVSAERLARAVERARERLSAAGATPAGGLSGSRFVEEFWVSEARGLVRLAAVDVDRVSAERDYMRLHVGKRSWLINHTIARLEEEPSQGSGGFLLPESKGEAERRVPRHGGEPDRAAGVGDDRRPAGSGSYLHPNTVHGRRSLSWISVRREVPSPGMRRGRKPRAAGLDLTLEGRRRAPASTRSRAASAKRPCSRRKAFRDRLNAAALGHPGGPDGLRPDVSDLGLHPRTDLAGKAERRGDLVVPGVGVGPEDHAAAVQIGAVIE
jgi:two-component system, LytTR family, response regulator AlgR